MTKDYNTDIQKLFLEIMLQDAETYVRVSKCILASRETSTLKIKLKKKKLYA
jgi:hypothetical protein